MEREGGLQRVGLCEANAERKGEESSQRGCLCEAVKEREEKGL